MTRYSSRIVRGAQERLFEPEAFPAQPSAASRLLALASVPPRPPGPALRRREEDDVMMRRLRRWGADLAAAFDLRWRALEPERDGITDWYGVCYDDGEIRIRLRHARSGRMLKESSLVDTLCHELAHLRYMDHSIRFRRLYRRILDRARQWGIYRPGREANAPRQLALFEGECAVGAGAQPHRRAERIQR